MSRAPNKLQDPEAGEAGERSEGHTCHSLAGEVTGPDCSAGPCGPR